MSKKRYQTQILVAKDQLRETEYVKAFETLCWILEDMNKGDE